MAESPTGKGPESVALTKADQPRLVTRDEQMPRVRGGAPRGLLADGYPRHRSVRPDQTPQLRPRDPRALPPSAYRAGAHAGRTRGRGRRCRAAARLCAGAGARRSTGCRPASIRSPRPGLSGSAADCRGMDRRGGQSCRARSRLTSRLCLSPYRVGACLAAIALRTARRGSRSRLIRVANSLGSWPTFSQTGDEISSSQDGKSSFRPAGAYGAWSQSSKFPGDRPEGCQRTVAGGYETGIQRRARSDVGRELLGDRGKIEVGRQHPVGGRGQHPEVLRAGRLGPGSPRCRRHGRKIAALNASVRRSAGATSFSVSQAFVSQPVAVTSSSA